jgi:hypothetical protein
MAKISSLKDTEGTEKEQQFLNCNKTMREHFCWYTGSIKELSAQQATYLLGHELREHDTAYFKVTNGLKVFYEGNNCWNWFLDQPANFVYALLEERRRLNFHMLDGIIGIDKVGDFYTVQKTEY